MKLPLVLSAIGLGFVLFVLSLCWTQIFTGASQWTPEKAELWAKTKDRLHNLSFVVNSPKPPRRHADLDAAREEYDRVKAASTKLQAEFESAYNGPRTTATVLKWAGIACFGLGIVGHYTLKG
ncbi:hypothetical protein Mal64_27990 [Pseudobythopirellula maris]|uniref:Uncharacterized protein n=1 Tax=Pseudobythopirellula maris TaxID=2527991 RepID=A0A5C5ZKF2_9BACT|nr:hypothetical protein [Pseudobythopirellula maris]TWT87261.1 hypothetical protein Mal64_27990 [Pseudobythopirellula maris]